MSIEGVRVVRGPDWSYGNQDGGEGHVGTITQDNEDHTVEIQWDMGEKGAYNTGKDGKFDLRILDSAPAGLKHDYITCDGCGILGFPGTRWKCQTCPDFDLCTTCYFQDLHDLKHPFLRIDVPGRSGVAVAKRSISTRLRALGIYPGSKVKRGEDWNAGDQDGGVGTIGTVVAVTNHGTSGHERDAVKVAWPNNKQNSYRVGYRGKVDLHCVEESPGTDYYKDHLFALDTTSIARAESIKLQTAPIKLQTAPIKLQTAPKKLETASKPTSAVCGSKLQTGDKVCVILPEMTLKEVQKGHGGYSMRMHEYIGKHGTLKKFEDNGDCVISFDDKDWRFNVDAIGKVPSFNVGDTVRIIDNEDQAMAVQRHHGGWNADMKPVLGKVGKVVKIDSDGDIAVSFGSKAWVFNAAACQPAPGATVYKVDDKVEAGPTKRSDTSLDTGSNDSDSDKLDFASEALGHLIAQLYLLQLAGQRSVKGAKHLISAAAQNDRSAVVAILKDNPNLIDEKDQELTALIIAAHEGHDDIVKILLKAGANKDLTEKRGNTALMAALMKKREASAIMLIEAGANIQLINDQKRTALHFAAANSANNSLRELLNRKADPNKQDIAGDTPLHDAILNKNDTGVAFLVAASSMNLKLCNNKGFSPLHLAALKDDEITVTRILSKAPELKNSTKEDKYTPLHIAAVNNNTGVVKALLKAKVNVEATNHQGFTALHLAAHQGYIETAKVLIEASANVNAKDEDGDTPLHNCVMGRRSKGDGDQLARLLGIHLTNDNEIQERINLACCLIQQGSDINIRNKRGRTPLQCCSDDKMRKAIGVFAEKQSGGARTRSRDNAADLLAELFRGLLTPCALCSEKISDTKFVPCGHKICCQRCSFRVSECPSCNTIILARTDLEGNRLALQDPCKVQ